MPIDANVCGAAKHLLTFFANSPPEQFVKYLGISPGELTARQSVYTSCETQRAAYSAIVLNGGSSGWTGAESVRRSVLTDALGALRPEQLSDPEQSLQGAVRSAGESRDALIQYAVFFRRCMSDIRRAEAVRDHTFSRLRRLYLSVRDPAVHDRTLSAESCDMDGWPVTLRVNATSLCIAVEDRSYAVAWDSDDHYMPLDPASVRRLVLDSREVFCADPAPGVLTPVIQGGNQ